MTALLKAESFYSRTHAESHVVHETPRFAGPMTLVAVHSAVGCARMFASHALRQWNARCVEDDALMVVTGLVTNAVTATGVIDEHPRWSELDRLNLIKLRLLDMGASIVIEVWDSDPAAPESTRQRWNYYHPRSGGKVVWCQLEFSQHAGAIDQAQALPTSLPRRKPRPSPRPTRPLATGEDSELLRRVRDGLRNPGAGDSSGGDDMRC